METHSLLGTLVAWHPADGVGQIRLDSGGELRVGQTAFGYQTAALGSRCEVLATAPHPLGGQRATKVKLLSAPPPEPPLPMAISELHGVMQRSSGGSVRVFEAWRASMPPTTDHFAWLLERIRRSTLFRGVQVELERLERSHTVLRGGAPPTPVYGIDLAAFDDIRKVQLLAAIEAQLDAWKEAPIAPLDRVRLHRIGQRLGLPSLLMSDPPALRSEPLGTTEGLDAVWQSRVALWKECVAGRRPLAASVIGLEAGDAIAFGAAADDTLRDTALEYELRSGGTFSRELAAIIAVADGVEVGVAAFLAPVARWTWNDDGLEIGCGRFVQGSLTLVERARQPMVTWRVLDRDDDGETLASFANVGAFFDALLR